MHDGRGKFDLMNRSFVNGVHGPSEIDRMRFIVCRSRDICPRPQIPLSFVHSGLISGVLARRAITMHR